MRLFVLAGRKHCPMSEKIYHRNEILEFMSNFMFFEWYLICFEILYQYPGIYPQGDPLGASPALKTNYMAYINNF